MITPVSSDAREARTQQQIGLIDLQLTREFSKLSADIVHAEVARVSERLLAQAHLPTTSRC